MTWLRRAAWAPERMDDPAVDPVHLAGALDHVTAVNRWLGARRALVRHLPAALGPAGARTARVLDVGTGAGDLVLAVAEWGRRADRSLELHAVDRHAATLAVARERTAAPPTPGAPDPAGASPPVPAGSSGPFGPAVRWVRADGLGLPFATGSFDLVLLSMVLHHMDGSAQRRLLKEAGRVAAGGRVLVGELERSLPHYLGARLLAATVWRRNPVTRHDGPLSVRRAFTPAELRGLADAAGLTGARVSRHFFYRLVLLAEA